MATAVIPCGGRGTRMAAVAGALPKELLPVGGKPLLQWTLDEAAAAGCERAVVVTSPEKPQIAEFLAARGFTPPATVVVTQPEPRGLGDAITCARAAARGGAVAVLLPDNLFATRGAAPAIAQVLAAHRRTGLPCVLIAEIAGADAGRTGALGRATCRPRTDGLFDVVAVADKGVPRPADRDGTAPRTPIGRMVFTADGFERLERMRTRLAPGAELDDVPLLQELAAEGRLVGVPLAGTFFDVGLPAGYRNALAALT